MNLVADCYWLSPQTDCLFCRSAASLKRSGTTDTDKFIFVSNTQYDPWSNLSQGFKAPTNISS